MLAELAECWPEEAALEQVLVHERPDGRIVVTVWTSTPGEVVGRRGGTAAAMREKLRAVAGSRSLDLRVCPAAALPPAGETFGEATAEREPLARDLVPDLVGMSVAEAHAKAAAGGFSLTTADPDGVPISFAMANEQLARFVVLAQSPLPGTIAPLHSEIVVTIEERGGEAGDREPRVPIPPGGIEHAVENIFFVEELAALEGLE